MIIKYNLFFMKQKVQSAEKNLDALIASARSPVKFNTLMDAAMQQMELTCIEMRRIAETIRPQEDTIFTAYYVSDFANQVETKALLVSASSDGRITTPNNGIPFEKHAANILMLNGDISPPKLINDTINDTIYVTIFLFSKTFESILNYKNKKK